MFIPLLFQYINTSTSSQIPSGILVDLNLGNADLYHGRSPAKTKVCTYHFKSKKANRKFKTE